MTSSQYYGLSLLDRLNKAGTTAAFSHAVKDKNTEEMSRLLAAVDYSSDSSAATIQTFLNDPQAFQA